jgi:hypothetical protein
MNRPKLSAFPILAAATVAVVIYSPRDLALNVVIAVALIGLYIIFAPVGHDCDPPHSALGRTVAVDTLRNMQSGIHLDHWFRSPPVNGRLARKSSIG